MNLVALFLALALERAATQLFQLREPRWFDTYVEWTLARFRHLRGPPLIVVTILLVLLPVVPVALVAALFSGTLLDLPYLAFATFVLVFSLGPRDLKREVDDYVAALASDDRTTAANVAQEIMEHDAAQRTADAPATLEDAIFAQANNRLFGVALWFMATGPAGAWLFRVSDLLRRRAVFEYRERAADPSAVPPFVAVLQGIHGVLAWVPARILALGFALAGDFDRARQAWRTYARSQTARFFDINDHLLATVGRAALGVEGVPAVHEVLPLPDAERVSAAMDLVTRALVILLVAVSVLVLLGLLT
jgi:AmpE protein